MTYVLVLNEPFYYKNRKSGQRSRGCKYEERFEASKKKRIDRSDL